MRRTRLLKALLILPSLVVLVALFLTHFGFVGSHTVQLVRMSLVQTQLTPQGQLTLQEQPSGQLPPVFRGRTHALGWIVGSDCQRGMKAYLQTASREPDAALVGTGWIDPTNGHFINGQSNNCVPGSLSMDNVVQMVHSKGGMAYLTVTMDTEDAGSWTAQQQAAYIARATTDQAYIDNIVREAVRANYDGVIMDLEEANPSYPSIQQLFATYNQHLWAALQPLHKLYGIALIHKVSDRDAYYQLNAFQDWRLLAHAADFLVVMAIDQSHALPGPAVSSGWFKQILAYALQTMPNMLPNIIWELPLYGNSWHWNNGQWSFDGIVTYQEAQALIGQLPPQDIDGGASAMQDMYAPHVVYSDTSGEKHALWYPTPQALYRMIVAFQQALQQVPQLKAHRIQLAFWWRTTLELQGFWQLLDTLY
jgi:spore germination protein YaaH